MLYLFLRSLCSRWINQHEIKKLVCSEFMSLLRFFTQFSFLPSFHLCCDCLKNFNFQSDLSLSCSKLLLLIHPAGLCKQSHMRANVKAYSFIHGSFILYTRSISHLQLICFRLTGSIMCSVTLTEKTEKCNNPFLPQPFILFSPSVLLCDIYYPSQ